MDPVFLGSLGSSSTKISYVQGETRVSLPQVMVIDIDNEKKTHGYTMYKIWSLKDFIELLCNSIEGIYIIASVGALLLLH